MADAKTDREATLSTAVAPETPPTSRQFHFDFGEETLRRAAGHDEALKQYVREMGARIREMLGQ